MLVFDSDLNAEKFLTRSGVTTEVWSRRKLGWKGPTSQHSEKNWEIMVNSDVDVYTETLNHLKILQKTQKNNNLLKTERML